MRLHTSLLCALLALFACGGKHKATYETAAAPAAAAAAAPTASEEVAALWSQRGDKEKLQAALVKYEELHKADPTNRDALVHLTRGWYLIGDMHNTEKDAQLAAWDTAITWGKKCIALNKDFTGLLDKGDEDEATAARVATREDVPCFYWTATALGKWAKLSGIGKTLNNLPTVKAWMSRVMELEPGYFYAGPDRYFGAYYAAIPSFAGQDLNKSKEHFEKSIAAHPNYLATQVLMAENWAVKSQDKKSFEDLLNKVIASDPNAVPDIVAENTAEVAKAKALLARKDEFFAN
jgi:hypothetical protein